MSTLICAPTLEDLFRRAIGIERRAGEVYAALARRFCRAPEVAAAWSRLMADEDLHARVLQDICDRLSREQQISLADAAMWEHVVRIEGLLEGGVEASVGNLEEAYQLAHEIEYSEINAMFRFLATDVIPSEERKRFVARHLDEHHGKLEWFVDAVGDSESRRLIKVGPQEAVPGSAGP
jgi:rubrerythrin